MGEAMRNQLRVVSQMRFLAIGLACLCFPNALQADEPIASTPKQDSQVYRHILRKPGDDGSKAYRIPGLALTKSGSLIAVFDIRHDGSGDLPANIDVGSMRSTDNGTTWSPMQRILDFDKAEPNTNGNGVGDPTILVDMKSGTIFVFALWSHGNRGWNGSGPGLEPSETGQLVLTKSTDDGLTWSDPINITKQVKDPSWRLCFNGPGAGIQTQNGTLIVPAQFRESDGPAHSCFLSSRDGGESWTISPAAISAKPPTSESQVVELKDGSLLLTMRDESRSGQRAWAKWTWNDSKQRKFGSWSEPWSNLPDSTCMASIVRHPNGQLIYSSPNNPKQRIAMTIRTSNDDGKTWSSGKLLDPRESMYSCLAIDRAGQVCVLYEVAGTLTFARFPFQWLLDSENK